MKASLLTFALAFVASVAMAYLPASSLNVTVLGRNPAITIVFNGQSYLAANNTLNLTGLAPGVYPVRVLRSGHPAHGLVYAGQVNIPARANVNMTVRPNGQVMVHATPIAPQYQPNYWDQRPGSVHIQNPNGNGGFVSTGTPGYCGTPVSYGMAPQAFASLRHSVMSQGFDSNRLAIAQQGIRHHGATSAQVAELMGLLSFESGRLELAKFAYGYVADPQNYFVVNNMFSFSSSVRELDQFIRGY